MEWKKITPPARLHGVYVSSQGEKKRKISRARAYGVMATQLSLPLTP